jgi:lambda repressor-like predicted transcriptional regulator
MIAEAVIQETGGGQGVDKLMTDLAQEPTGFEALVAACRAFARGLHAFRQLDAETRDDITTLVEASESGDLDSPERESVYAALAQTLFPRETKALTPTSWAAANEEERRIDREMDAEEATFAKRLEAAMRETGVSQVELAAAIDVGQPAISMMLKRSCRPQRRTVERIAQALGVNPEVLWPTWEPTRTVVTTSTRHFAQVAGSSFLPPCKMTEAPTEIAIRSPRLSKRSRTKAPFPTSTSFPSPIEDSDGPPLGNVA